MKKRIIMFMAILFFCTACTGRGGMHKRTQSPSEPPAIHTVNPNDVNSNYEKVTS